MVSCLPRALLALLLSLAAIAARGAPMAYVPNEGSGTVSVIDTATDKVVRTLRIGTKPRGIAAAPDGKRIFVSDQPSGTLLVYDVMRDTEVARIAVGKSPEAVYVARDGKLVSVTVEENDQVALIDAGDATL